LQEIPGLKESFKRAKIVLFTTFSPTGEKHIRQMTNLNEDPYSSMWFTSYTDSRKVADVKGDPKVVISFPSGRPGEVFEIEGKASLESQNIVNDRWSWWYLYWRPEQSDRFWFPRGVDHPEWAILNVEPVSAKRVMRG
jgi:general stress protein 26